MDDGSYGAGGRSRSSVALHVEPVLPRLLQHEVKAVPAFAGISFGGRKLIWISNFRRATTTMSAMLPHDAIFEIAGITSLRGLLLGTLVRNAVTYTCRGEALVVGRPKCNKSPRL